MNNKTPLFKNYINWQSHQDRNSITLREYLISFLPHEIIINCENMIDLREVGEYTEGKWSAFFDPLIDKNHYFFELEIDLVTFKLRWL